MLSKVTIITVVRNLIDAGRKDTFLQMLQSVRQQDYSAIEHLVIDGASTDGTVELLQQEGVSFISEPDNGIHPASNKGIARAQGKYIAFLNSDDFYESSQVVSQAVEALEHSGADFTYAPMFVLERNGCRTLRKPHWKACFCTYPIATPTMFMSKKMLEDLGGFDESYKIAADYDLIMRALLRGYRPVSVSEPGVVFRMGGISDTEGSQLRKEEIRVIESNFGLSHKQAIRARDFQCMPQDTLKQLLHRTRDFPATKELLRRNLFFNFKFILRQLITIRLTPGRRCFRLLGITFYNQENL